MPYSKFAELTLVIQFFDYKITPSFSNQKIKSTLKPLLTEGCVKFK